MAILGLFYAAQEIFSVYLSGQTDVTQDKFSLEEYVANTLQTPNYGDWAKDSELSSNLLYKDHGQAFIQLYTRKSEEKLLKVILYENYGMNSKQILINFPQPDFKASDDRLGTESQKIKIVLLVNGNYIQVIDCDLSLQLYQDSSSQSSSLVDLHLQSSDCKDLNLTLKSSFIKNMVKALQVQF